MVTGLRLFSTFCGEAVPFPKGLSEGALRAFGVGKVISAAARFVRPALFAGLIYPVLLTGAAIR